MNFKILKEIINYTSDNCKCYIDIYFYDDGVIQDFSAQIQILDRSIYDLPDQCILLLNPQCANEKRILLFGPDFRDINSDIDNSYFCLKPGRAFSVDEFYHSVLPIVSYCARMLQLKLDIVRNKKHLKPWLLKLLEEQ